MGGDHTGRDGDDRSLWTGEAEDPGPEEGPLQGGSASAEIGQLFLVDLLCTEYYRRYYDACSKNNEKTSQSVLDKLY